MSDDRWIEFAVAVAGGLAAVLVVRYGLTRAFAGLERRGPEDDASAIARRRTTLVFVRRVIVAVVAVVAAWNALAVFDATKELGQALLASSAVLAIFAGLAFNTPLSNLGSGLLVAFAQPLRLGDRVTVGEHTGFVEEMSLLYTTLVTDDARRVFIPNTQLTSSTVVNRTIRDPRRAVSVNVPVSLSEVERAHRVAAEAVEAMPGTLPAAARVLVGDVTEKAVWLSVTVYAPLDADVAQLGSELRERVLVAFRREDLLPA
jgi:small-conductance mechanosensitive channel